MSLNFDLRDVRKRLGEDRYDEFTTSPDTRDKPGGEQKWHPITDAIIWFSLAVDLGSIDEKNVDEWCFRIGLLHTLSGEGRHDVAGGLGGWNINRKDIENHIGLSTNVSTKTRAAWLAKIFRKDAMDEVKVIKSMNAETSAAEQVNAAMAEYTAKEAANK